MRCSLLLPHAVNMSSCCILCTLHHCTLQTVSPTSLAVAYCAHCTWQTVSPTSHAVACCSHKFAFRSKMKDAIGVHHLTLSRGSSTAPGLLSKSAAASRRTSKYTHPPFLACLFCIPAVFFLLHHAGVWSTSYDFCSSLSLLHGCMPDDQFASLLSILHVLM